MAQYDAEGNKLVQIWVYEETREKINKLKNKNQSVGSYVKGSIDFVENSIKETGFQRRDEHGTV